jgi:radical SAM superfamily enzyme YgiQ (UPF0313 family)
VVVGFEDIQDRRIKDYNKKYKAQVIPRAIELLHEMGMLIVGDFIVSPDYTEEDFAHLERFIVERGIQIPVLSVLTPIPGTPLYKKMKDRISIHDLDFYTFTNAVVPTAIPEHIFYGTFSELVKRLQGRAPQVRTEDDR